MKPKKLTASLKNWLKNLSSGTIRNVVGSSTIIILYLFSVFGYSLTRGFYSYQIFLILFSCFLLFFGLFLGILKNNFGRLPIEPVALFVFFIEILLFVLLFGGIYQIQGSAYLAIKFLLPLVLILSIFFLITKSERVYMLNFIAMVLLGVVLRVLMVVSSPSPKIDVYDMLKIGPAYLIHGKNPYSEFYPQKYVGVVPDYFTYFPMMLTAFLPSDLIFNDPRYTFVAADFLTLFLLYRILKKSKLRVGKYILPLIFFYHPSTGFILEQSWVEPLVFAAMVSFIYLEVFNLRYRKYSFLPLALFLGAKQSMLILLPFLFLFKKIKKWKIIFACFTVGLVTLPFLIWSFKDFYKDTVRLLITYPSRYDSITVNTFFHSHWGRDIPKIFLYFVWAMVGIFSLVWAASRLWSRFVLAIAFFLFAFYLFNKLAFIHYYFLISLLIFLAAILRFCEESKMS